MNQLREDRKKLGMDPNLNGSTLKNAYLKLQDELKKHGKLEILNIEVSVAIDLSAVYDGSEVEVFFERTTFDDLFHPIRVEKLSKWIIITSRYLEDSVYILRGEGNIYAEDVQSDLIVKLEIKRPSGFDFKGTDLILWHQLSLKEALLSSSLTVRDIKGQQKIITLSGPINPASVLKLPGEGFVKAGTRHSGRDLERGDMYVFFDITFPEFIKLEDKKVLQQILKPQAAALNLA